jgi:tryptophan-rich sensory protein
LVWRPFSTAAYRKRAALRTWGWQLLANALWPAAFFGIHNPGLGLVVIATILLTIAATIRAFWPLQRAAALLLLPYACWMIFATYLNIGFWWLNRS